MRWFYETQSRLKSPVPTAFIEDCKSKFMRFDINTMIDTVTEILLSNGEYDFQAYTTDQEALKIFLPLINKNIRFHAFAIRMLAPVFSFGIKEYSHSVAVVIDTVTRKCFIIDSLPANPVKRNQIENVLSQLQEYSLKYLNCELDLESDPCAGMNTTANMIGLILGAINKETGEGLVQGDGMASLLGDIFSRAMASVHEKRHDLPGMIKDLKIKQALIAESGKFSTHSRQDDISKFRLALKEGIKLIEESALWKQQKFTDFIAAFVKSNPENIFADPIMDELYQELAEQSSLKLDDYKIIVLKHLNRILGITDEQQVSSHCSSSSMPVTPAAMPSLGRSAVFGLQFFSTPVGEARNKFALLECLKGVSRQIHDTGLKMALQPMFEALSREFENDQSTLRDGHTNIRSLGAFLTEFYASNPVNKSRELFMTEAFEMVLKDLGNITAVVEKKERICVYLKEQQVVAEAELSASPAGSSR